MFRKIGVLITALACVSLGMVTSVGLSAASAASPPLVLEGNTGVTFTNNFNPYDSSSFCKEMSVCSLVYEPLFEFDTIKAGTADPWLATAYAWSNGGKTLTFTIRTGVKWSNGAAFTPADVAATFNGTNNNAAANVYGLPSLASPATVSGNTVVLNYATPEYSNITAIAGTELMVPSSFWTTYSPVATSSVSDSQAIGTGPYVPSSYSSSVVDYTANATYWGTAPAANEVQVLSVDTNADAATDLADGTLTWAGNDIANVNSIFVDKDKATNHTFFAPGNTVTLQFNVTKAPLNDPKVREAISVGINRKELGIKGESGYELPATSLSGLILPNQAGYLGAQFKNDVKATNDPTMVKKILTADGYKKNHQGFYAKNGKEIKFSIEDPISYSDYYADAQLMSSELKSEGIDATVYGVQAAQWYTDSADGNFTSIEHWGNGGTNPYTQYDNWLDYTTSAPNGKSANADYGRYHNTAVQADLAKLAGTNPSDTAAVKAASLPLEKVVATQLPVIPLLYGATWCEYSTANYTGFPTPSNPYMDPAPGDPELPYILTHITAVS
ncbi:MAG: ABC transporter substrate-binding protein [Acidimicrobiales bacterium]|jgi:peptide/nickel transport system substrate-binding protein